VGGFTQNEVDGITAAAFASAPLPRSSGELRPPPARSALSASETILVENQRDFVKQTRGTFDTGKPGGTN